LVSQTGTQIVLDFTINLPKNKCKYPDTRWKFYFPDIFSAPVYCILPAGTYLQVNKWKMEIYVIFV